MRLSNLVWNSRFSKTSHAVIGSSDVTSSTPVIDLPNQCQYRHPLNYRLGPGDEVIIDIWVWAWTDHKTGLQAAVSPIRNVGGMITNPIRTTRITAMTMPFWKYDGYSS